VVQIHPRVPNFVIYNQAILGYIIVMVVFFDVDGTLIDGDDTIRPYAK
jgi:ribonucleotide monophosphatase NagD (HAD superfamily)